VKRAQEAIQPRALHVAVDAGRIDGGRFDRRPASVACDHAATVASLFQGAGGKVPGKGIGGLRPEIRPDRVHEQRRVDWIGDLGFQLEIAGPIRLPPGGALVGIHPPVDGVAAGVAGGTGSPGPGRPSIPRRRPVGFARWLHRGRAETHRFHLRVVLDQRLHPEGVHSAVEDSPASVVAVVHAGGDGELAEIAGTLDLFRPRLGARQSRQKQCRQDGGDGDDYGKFNQGKPVARSRSRRAAPSEGRVWRHLALLVAPIHQLDGRVAAQRVGV
jgi:hypothetical protein